MKDIRICIFDTDTIRAGAIKEVLSDEGYSVKIFSTEVASLKALLEESYDAIFVGLDFVDDIIEYLVKVRNYAPTSRIVGLLGGQYTDYQFTLAELGITRYIETPVSSTTEILDAVQGIESEIMDEDERPLLWFLSLSMQKKRRQQIKKCPKR